MVQSVKMSQRFCIRALNISAVGFVYTGAAGTQAVAGRIETENKPRGGSRGVNDTQLFRLLTRTRGVSFVRLLLSNSGVNSSFLPISFRLTRLWKGIFLMKSKSLLANLALCGALAIAVPLLAKPMSTTVPLTHSAKVGQTDLKAGEYRFQIDGNHLTILKGKNQVAEADGRWEDRDSKSDYTSIVSNAEGKVIELRFAGKKNVFVLAQ